MLIIIDFSELNLCILFCIILRRFNCQDKDSTKKCEHSEYFCKKNVLYTEMPTPQEEEQHKITNLLLRLA